MALHGTAGVYILTGNEGESAQTGESADIDVEDSESLTEVENTVQPIAETSLTLSTCEDYTVAECQTRVVGSRTVSEPQHEELQARRLEE